MFDTTEPTATRGSKTAAKRLLVAAVAAVPLLATPFSASAQLPFSPDCRVYQQIVVAPPANAILFSKHPAPHPNGTATVFAIDSLNNYVVPDGANSCIVAAPAVADHYCFLARSDNTIFQVGAAAIANPDGLPLCQ